MAFSSTLLARRMAGILFLTGNLTLFAGGAISSDPTDPEALWTVAQPPSGMFEGELSGQHSGELPQIIDGDWNLNETATGITCVGPFTVELQP